MGKFKDLTNQKFGKLSVIEVKGRDTGGHYLWLCACECGKQVVTSSNSLMSGKTKSCGCSRGPSIKKHGLTKTRLYHTWSNMKQRCINPKHPAYKNYGGRGITVCEEWLSSFSVFMTWATANGYSEDLSIDRIDVNGSYCPENCRWITMKEQGFNRRNNHIITYNGKTQTMRQWSDELGIDYEVIAKRLNTLRWSAEDAFKF